MAYLSYYNDPCNNEPEFKKQVAILLEDQRQILRFKERIMPLVECFLTKGMTFEEFNAAYQPIAAGYPTIDIESAVSSEISNTSTLVKEWEGARGGS